MASTQYIAWQRNDGLVGISTEAPRGFGDCSFRTIGTFATYNEAVDAANAAPGARRPRNSPLVNDPEPLHCENCGMTQSDMHAIRTTGLDYGAAGFLHDHNGVCCE